MKNYSYYIFLAFNALISLVFIVFHYEIHSSYYSVSLFLFIIILIKNRENILFFIRTFFLGIIGFIALGAKIVSNEAFFGNHMKDSQTIEIAILMLLLTNIALFSSEFGFLVGGKLKISKQSKIYFERKIFFIITYLCLIVIGALIIKSNGSLVISGGSYGSGEIKAKMLVSNLNVISNIVFYTLILIYFKFKDLYKVNVKRYLYFIVFAAFYLFIFAEFLRGVRMDALNGIFGAIVLYLVYNDKPLKVTPKIFFIGVILFIIIQIMGMLRSALNYLSFDEVIEVVKNGFKAIFEGSNSGILFYQGTINDIATTFSGTIMMIQENMINYYYGNSYFDYILRTPPKFLYPDRPEDLAWIFVNHGLTSGGGFFELAEAYLNFGVLGAFIVPFLVSLLISYSFKMFVLNKYSLLHSILLFSLLSGFMRGVLYQTFTFYKAIVTGGILYLLFYILLAILNKKKIQYSGMKS